MRPLATLLRTHQHSHEEQHFPMECTLLPVDPILTSPGPRLGSAGNKTYNPGGEQKHAAMLMALSSRILCSGILV